MVGLASSTSSRTPSRAETADGSVRLIGRCGLAAMVFGLAMSWGIPATASPVQRDPSNFVLANGSGSDFQIESPSTGKVIKDLGTIAGYTDNGLAYSPDGKDVYLTVVEPMSLEIERIDVANGRRAFVADGEEPSISPNGRFLAYGAGPEGSQQLFVRDLSSGAVRSINLRKLLGGQTDLLTASITWLGNGSELVVLPGGVGNDLMGNPIPAPVPGSCSAVPASSTCLIVVKARTGHALTATRVVLHSLRSGYGPIGASGPNLFMAAFHGGHTDMYEAQVTRRRASAIHLFSMPAVLPVAFDARGTKLFYLVGHSPVALWLADVTPHGLDNARMLNANVALAGLAW